jgi:hypothetical protein
MNQEKRNKFLDMLAICIIFMAFIAFMILMTIIIGYGGPWYAYLIWPTLCAILTIIGWAFNRLSKI